MGPLLLLLALLPHCRSQPPPADAFVVYVADTSPGDRFSLPLAGQHGETFHCDPEPLLTTQHVAAIRHETRAGEPRLVIELTPAGLARLEEEAEDYRERWLVIAFTGRVLAAPKVRGPIGELALGPALLSLPPPGHERLEALVEEMRRKILGERQ